MEHRSSILTMLPGARFGNACSLLRRLCNKEIFSCLKRVIPRHASALLKLETVPLERSAVPPLRWACRQTRESKRVRRRPRSPRALSAAWESTAEAGKCGPGRIRTLPASRTIDSL
jgi:hypothetical protein